MGNKQILANFFLEGQLLVINLKEFKDTICRDEENKGTRSQELLE